jgi:hypothetical protein
LLSAFETNKDFQLYSFLFKKKVILSVLVYPNENERKSVCSSHELSFLRPGNSEGTPFFEPVINWNSKMVVLFEKGNRAYVVQ